MVAGTRTHKNVVESIIYTTFILLSFISKSKTKSNKNHVYYKLLKKRAQWCWLSEVRNTQSLKDCTYSYQAS